jgi:hypothetical protein
MSQNGYLRVNVITLLMGWVSLPDTGWLTLPWENIQVSKKVLVAQVAYQSLDNGISVLLTKTLVILLAVRLPAKFF